MFLLSLLLGLYGASSVYAQQDDSADRARVLFQKGVANASNGQFEEAVAAFSASKALRAAPTTSYNLAAALFELGRFVEAYQHLQGLNWPAGSSFESRSRADTLAGRLESRIAHLTVNLASAEPNLRIWLDGTQIPDTQRGVPSVISPGAYTLRVQRGDTLLLTRALHVEAHAKTLVEVCLVPSVAPAGPNEARRASEAPAREPSRPLLRKSWQFWTVVGSLVVASGVAITIVATHHSDAHDAANNATTAAPLRW